MISADPVSKTASATSDLTIHTSLPVPSAIQQIDGLQILRAVAVFLVAWAHAGLGLSFPGQRNLPDLGIFGIDIFFVISGFILSFIVLRARQPRGVEAAWYFLKRRLIRIFPIYWIFVALTFLRMWRGAQLRHMRFLPSLFLLPSPSYPVWWMLIPVAWTLVFEMFFYYVLALIQLFTVKRAVPCLIASLSLAVALGTIYSIRRPYLILVGNPILLEFVFGACLALLFRRFGRRRLMGIVLTLGGAIGAIAVRALCVHGAASMEMILADDQVWRRVLTWGLAAGTLTAGVIFWSPSPKGRPGKIAVVLGNASYSAYLGTSLALEFTFRGLFALLRDHPPFSTGVHFVCQVIGAFAVLVVGWVFYQFVEWPLLRKLQARFNSGKAIAARGSTAVREAS